MLFLALDTCDPRGSLAVFQDANLLQCLAHDTPEDYSSWLLPAFHTALKAARVAPADLQLYAVAAGPGSFTGVRIGLTTVKAWAEVYGCPLVSISRLEALASEASGTAPHVAAFTDAHRGQVFGALYRRDSQLQRLDEEVVIAPETFANWVAETAGSGRVDWISTDPECVTATKAWSARRAMGETVQLADPILAPTIGRLGYQRALEKQLSDALTLDANYVRRSDAELLWKDGPAKR